MNNNVETQENYDKFIKSNFDSEWQLEVTGGGEGWVDHHKRNEDWLEFQHDMASGFISSYSVISPLRFIEYKYCELSGSQFATFHGLALGNMAVKGTKATQHKKKMMTTHQVMNLQFIKRQNSKKWKLYKEESTVTVLELGDAA